MKKIFCFFIFFLLIASLSHAEFTVIFRDHTQRQVTKIEFKGDNADLYLVTGMVLTVPAVAIDYQLTGIERPKSAYGVTVYGKGQSTTSSVQPPAPKGPSQEELKSQWEKAEQTAIATGTAGSIHKGDKVRVVSSTDLSYTLVVHDANGVFRRETISAESFSENFEVEKKVSISPPAAPLNTPLPSVSTSATPAQSKTSQARLKPKLPAQIPKISDPTTGRPSLWGPFFLSMALLVLGFGWTLALAQRKNSAQRR